MTIGLAGSVFPSGCHRHPSKAAVHKVIITIIIIIFIIIFIVVVVLNILTFSPPQATQRPGCLRCQGGECRCRLLPQEQSFLPQEGRQAAQDWRERMERVTGQEGRRGPRGGEHGSSQMASRGRERTGGWNSPGFQNSQRPAFPQSTSSPSNLLASAGSPSRSQQPPTKPRRSPARPPASRL